MATAQSLSMLSLDDNYKMVAAFDFGTTFSGYAFSLKNDPSKIFMNKSWRENVGFQSYKTPTCLLLNDKDPDEVYFGYVAEDKYAEIQENEETRNNYHMFRHFKMMLHKSGSLTLGNTVCAIDGTTANALTIFSKSLGYLKNHMISAVNKHITGEVDETRIRWVLTVPAIWSDKAKQFMREAAYQAGMIRDKDSRQLLIALEPEAASLFCRSDIKDAEFEPGCKYLVIDAGGGTIDLTAHEVKSDDRVKEIHSASGGAWGGTKVDQNFEKLIEDILGSDFVQKFKKECAQPWLHFMVEFEKKKRSINNDDESKITVSLPFIMGSKYLEICGKDMQEAINKHSDKGVKFSNGMLVLQHSAALALFDPVLKQICSHIDKQLKVPAMHDCAYLMVVGGFGESALLQQAIRDKFGSRARMIVPEEAQMSVIRGAVIFGHHPDMIGERKVKYTYGMKIMQDFDDSKHDKKYKKKMKNGDVLCDKVFKPFVLKDEDVKIGETATQIVKPIRPDQVAATLVIYQSENRDVKYVDEQGCKQLGKIRVVMGNVDKGMDRKVEVEMTFGGTEIQVKATDVESGNTAEAVLDFLGDDNSEDVKE